MSDDLVKRLRELYTFAAEQMSRDWDEQPEVHRLFRLVFFEVFYAADRIEKLEAALREVLSWVDQYSVDATYDDHWPAIEELARKALEGDG